jgi:predicted MFS family arabinose efflux permease
MRRLWPRQVTLDALRHAARGLETRSGGRARLRVIVLFAGVQGLATADQGTVGAIAPQLEGALHISNGGIGVIAAVAALSGALGTLPVGVLTDRVHRIGLLAGSIVLWSAAMVAAALAPSFLFLLLTRVALGAVTATAGPTLASLIGDFFPTRERAKIWGLILTGELLGAGIGVVVSGDLANALSWRYGFGWLAVPGLLLALGISRLLVEPARGGQSRLEPGAREFVPAPEAESVRASASASDGRGREAPGEDALDEEQELAQRAVAERQEEPHAELVLDADPVDMPVWDAVRYVLRVRTNRILITASALGYLFFAGVQTFAVLLMRSHYGLGQSAASALLVLVGLGALMGAVLGGRLADRLLRKGRVNARVMVGAVGYMAAAAIFVPGLASPVLVVSLPLFALAAMALAAPNPALNAARLDVIHTRLWGRAEGVRTVLQMFALAAGPLLFGLISGALGGPHHGTSGGAVKHTSALAYTFLIMLVPVAAGGLILLRARHTYPRDVATAAASIEATSARPTRSSERDCARQAA